MSRYWNDIYLVPDDELVHFGIKGQHWGIRRYQNEDGSLTSAGAARYAKLAKKYSKASQKAEKYAAKADKHYYKAGGIKGTLFDGYAEKQLRKSARNNRKSLKQQNKSSKYKRKIQKLMKATNTTLDDALAAMNTDTVTQERLKTIFA